tara:strand:- start:7 stop:1026 length:1020 start_codon:yes stop_codon:yes gene_type:complete
MSFKLNGTNILVTGADGFIGSHLCEQLITYGANVKALVFYNSFNKVGWLEDINPEIVKSMEIISGDVRDSEMVCKLTKNVDIIFHLAALISIPYSYTSPRSFVQTNLLGTLNILEGAKANNCNRIISTSTSEVYGSALVTPIDEEHRIQAQSPYAASKISADHILESYVRSYNMPAVVLRPFNTYGPRQSEKAVIANIIRQAIDDSIKEIKIGTLTTKRDFNYVSDTVMAFIMLALVPDKKISYGSVYNAGSGHSITIKNILDIILSMTNSNKNVIVDKKRFRPEKSEVLNLVASSKKIKKLTGWHNRIDMEEGLKKTIIWWKKRKEINKLRASSNYSI